MDSYSVEPRECTKDHPTDCSKDKAMVVLMESQKEKEAAAMLVDQRDETMGVDSVHHWAFHLVAHSVTLWGTL